MNGLLAHVLPLAVGAAISPTLLVVQVLILSGKHKPVSRAVGVAVGAGVVLLGLSLAFATLLTGFGQTPSGEKPSLVSEIIRVVAALLLLFLGIRSVANRKRPPNTARAQRFAEAKWREFVAVGMVIMITNISTLVLFAPALHMIVTAPVPEVDKAIAYCVLFLITMAPLLVPLGAAVALGDRAKPWLARLNAFVTRHNATISAIVCFGFAAYLIYLATAPYV